MATCPIDNSAFDSPLWIQIKDVVSVTAETNLTIVEGRTVLKEIPRRTEGVQIIDGGTPLTEIRDINALLNDGEYRVDYVVGWIYFNPDFYPDGTSLDTFNYTSRGVILYPYSRIITQNGDLLGDGINEVYSDGVLVSDGIGKFDFRQNIEVVYDPLDPHRVIINVDPNAGFGGAFIDLSDCPSTYVGQKFKVPYVLENELGLDFADIDTLIGLIEPSIDQNVPYANSIGSFGTSKSGSSVAIKGVNIVNEFLAYGRTLDWLVADGDEENSYVDVYSASLYPVDYVENQKYFVTYKQKITGATFTASYGLNRIAFTSSTIPLYNNQVDLQTNEYVKYSGIFTAPDTENKSISFFQTNTFPSTHYIKDAIIIPVPSDITTVAEMEALLDGTILDQGTHSAGEAVDLINLLDNRNDFGNYTTFECTVNNVLSQDDIPYIEMEGDGASFLDAIVPSKLSDNTLYTVLTHILRFDGSGNLVSVNNTGLDFTPAISITPSEGTGVHKKTFTTGTITINQIGSYVGSGTVSGEKIIFRQVILEGDYTHLTDDEALKIIKNRTLEKFELEQVISNPGFDDGTTGWSSNGSIFSVSDGIATFRANSADDAVYRTATSNIGQDYFVIARVKATSSDVALVYFDLEFAEEKAYHSGSGEFEILTLLGNSNSNAANSLQVRDERTSAWDDVEIDYVMVIPALRSYSKSEMTVIVDDNVWEGTEVLEAQAVRVSGVRYKTVGKNNLDIINWVNSDLNSVGVVSPPNSNYYEIVDVAANTIKTTTSNDTRAWSKVGMIKLIPNTQYKFSATNTSLKTVEMKDSQGNLLGSSIANPVSITITTPDDGLVGFKFSTGDSLVYELSNIQIELGTTATTYKKYRELYAKWHTSDFGAQGIDGVFDDSETQRFANPYIFDSDESFSLFTSFTNLDYVYINRSVFEGYKHTSGSASNLGKISTEGFISLYNSIADTVAYIGTMTPNGGANTAVWYGFAKGTFASTAEAKAYFSGKKTIYELAEYITRTEANNNLTLITGGLILDAVGTYEQSGNGVIGDFKVSVPLNVYAQLVLNIIMDLKQQKEINGLQVDMEQVIADNITQFEQMGYLPDLSTTDKTNLVSAINELFADILVINADILALEADVLALQTLVDNPILDEDVEYNGGIGRFDTDALGATKNIFGENFLPIHNIQGRTLEYINENPAFKDGDTGWTVVGGTQLVTSEINSVTVSGGSSGAYIRKLALLDGLSDYYVKARVRVTNAIATGMYLRDSGTIVAEQLAPTINQWYELSAIFTSTGNDFQIRHGYGDTVGGYVMEVDYAIVIPLPSDITTLAEMEKVVNNAVLEKGTYGLGEAIELDQLLDNRNEFSAYTTADFTVDKTTSQELIPYQKFESSGTTKYSKVPTLLEINTRYTILLSVLENTADNDFYLDKDMISTNINTIVVPAGETGIFKVAFTTQGTVPSVVETFLNLANGKIIVKAILVKDDYTNISDELALKWIQEQEFGTFLYGGITYKSKSVNQLDYAKVISDNSPDIRLVEFEDKLCLNWTADAAGSALRIMEGEFIPLTQYTITVDCAAIGSSSSLRIQYTDGTVDTMLISAGSLASKTITSAVGKSIDYLKGTFNSSQEVYLDVNTFIVNIGTTQLPYEAYKESFSYVDTPRYGLQGFGGVYDDEDTQRFGVDFNDVLKSQTYTLSGTTGLTYQRFTLAIQMDTLFNIPIPVSTESGNFKLQIGSKIYTSIRYASIDIQAEIDANPFTCAINSSNKYLYIISDEADATAFNAAILAGDVKFIYELAEYIPRSKINNNEVDIFGQAYSTKEGTYEQFTPLGFVESFQINQPLNLNAQIQEIAKSQIKMQEEIFEILQMIDYVDIFGEQLSDKIDDLETDLDTTNARTRINTYDRMSDLGLTDSSFGTDFATSINTILTALNGLDSSGTSMYLGYINTSVFNNLIGDINTELGLSESIYSLRVGNVRNEQSGLPSLALSNRVEVIAGSTGSIYVGTFDTDLTPDITMIKIAESTNDPVTLMSTEVSVPSTTVLASGADVALSESIDNFDAIRIAVSYAGNDTEIQWHEITLGANSDEIDIITNSDIATAAITYRAFKVERETTTNLRVYHGSAYGLSVGSPAAFTYAPNSAIDIQKVIGINY